MQLNLENARVAVLGLGYVGLPLAIECGSRYPTTGFDLSRERIKSLQQHLDANLEVEQSDFNRARHLTFTYSLADLVDCNTYIISVPTPIDHNKQPDCSALITASRSVGSVIAPGDVVIYESTVYPGATEEVCIPEVEQASGLRINKDFFAGYSPERINPGDKTRRLTDIIKVTSGSSPATADYVDNFYASIVNAGTHRTSSIRVAEAAKVIENTQRDLNIALVNELAMIFAVLELDTEEVLEAAGTKWNFLPFRPGLVGGHCIGVDPYYLTHKAQAIGYHPQMILAGRRINDRMGEHVAERVVKLMAHKAINLVGARVLVMGLAFKENCPDVRNTKVVDVVRGLKSFHINVDVYDPWVNPHEAQREHDLTVVEQPDRGAYDAIVIAVAHDTFRELVERIKDFTKPEHVIFDVKQMLPKTLADGRL